MLDPASLPINLSTPTTSKMEPILIIPDHPPNPYYPHSTTEDESRPAQCPLRYPTESDDPTDDRTLFHRNMNLLGDLGIGWDDEDPIHPFRFLDLPLEIQLGVVDMLSESYESYDRDESLPYRRNISYDFQRRHPLLDLRQ